MMAMAGSDSQDIVQLGRHLAHELNNPISSIASAAYLIEDFITVGEQEKIDGDAIRPFIESIRDECLRLKGIIEEFTKYLTTDSALKGRIDLLEFLQARARENTKDGLDVQIQVSDDTGLVIEGDMGQMQYAFNTIAQVAKEAGATSLVVEGKRINGAVELEFKDNRPKGLSADEAKQVFSSVPAKTGVGLGLKMPTVKKIIELHKGTIEIKGQETSGAVVRVSVPSQN
jgi:nitrogen fixation/metabolism regulation signal transduction histidine kinase